MIPFSFLTKLQQPWIILMLAVALLIVALALFADRSSSDTKSIVVNTTDDEDNHDGDCSLREAIRTANLGRPADACVAENGANTVFLPEGRYQISAQRPLDIRKDLTIIGAGPGKTIIEIGGIEGASIGSAFKITDAHFNVSGVSIYPEDALQGTSGGLD